MRRANIHDRGTIESIYPRAVFQQEANANARAKASVLSGVRITSAPDAEGAFDLARASRHTGEAEASDGAIFLSPIAQDTAHGAEYPVAADSHEATGGGDPYSAFIDKIIATARDAPIAPSPGRGDVRLRGLRQ